MSFKKTFAITTIDPPGTTRMEDGFCVNLRYGTINIVSVIPDFQHVPFDIVTETLKESDQEIRRRMFYFPKNRGFVTYEARRALVVKIKYPYVHAIVGIGKAIIRQQLTYQQADEMLQSSPSLKVVHDYTSNQVGKVLDAKNIILHLLEKFNDACASAMKSKNMYLFNRRHGIVTIGKDFGEFNRPLRDPVSFINCLRLVTYLETGLWRFADKRQLSELIRPVTPR